MLFVLFPLLHILSLSLIFVILITMCLSVFFLEFILPGTPCTSWTWLIYFFSHVLKVFSYYHFKLFLRTFLSCFSFWDPYNVNVGVLNVVLEVSQAVFIISFHSFSILCSVAVTSTIPSSRSFICSSVSVILLLIPSGVLFISVYSLVLVGLW